MWVGTVYKNRINYPDGGCSLEGTLFWCVFADEWKSFSDCQNYAKENGIPFTHIKVEYKLPEDF